MERFKRFNIFFFYSLENMVKKLQNSSMHTGNNGAGTSADSPGPFNNHTGGLATSSRNSSISDGHPLAPVKHLSSPKILTTGGGTICLTGPVTDL